MQQMRLRQPLMKKTVPESNDVLSRKRSTAVSGCRSPSTALDGRLTAVSGCSLRRSPPYGVLLGFGSRLQRFQV